MRTLAFCLGALWEAACWLGTTALLAVLIWMVA